MPRWFFGVFFSWGGVFFGSANRYIPSKDVKDVCMPDFLCEDKYVCQNEVRFLGKDLSFCFFPFVFGFIY